MKAVITIDVALNCTVTGTWVPPDPGVGQSEGYWDDIEIRPRVTNLWDLIQADDDTVVEAIDALERAAEAELETSQEP